MRAGLVACVLTGARGAERALEDRDRSLCAHARRVELAEMLLHEAEVGERDRDVGVLGARRRPPGSRSRAAYGDSKNAGDKTATVRLAARVALSISSTK